MSAPSKYIKIVAVLLLTLGICYLAIYEILLHSPANAQLAFVRTQVEARLPTGLTGMISVSSDLIPISNAVERSPSDKAKLAETWLHALSVAMAAQQLHGERPQFSTGLSLGVLKPEHKFDAWDRPFCLSYSGTATIVMSSGLSADTQPICSNLSAITPERLSRLRGKKLYILPSGYAFLFVTNNAQSVDRSPTKLNPRGVGGGLALHSNERPSLLSRVTRPTKGSCSENWKGFRCLDSWNG